jgi:hypothetical protein
LLTAMDPILPKIFSVSALRNRSVWLSFHLIQPIRFSIWMWCCMVHSQGSTRRNSPYTFTIARGSLQSRKETSFLSSGLPGCPHLRQQTFSQALRVLGSFLLILRLYLKGSLPQHQSNLSAQIRRRLEMTHLGERSDLF